MGWSQPRSTVLEIPCWIFFYNLHKLHHPLPSLYKFIYLRNKVNIIKIWKICFFFKLATWTGQPTMRKNIPSGKLAADWHQLYARKTRIGCSLVPRECGKPDSGPDCSWNASDKVKIISNASQCVSYSFKVQVWKNKTNCQDLAGGVDSMCSESSKLMSIEFYAALKIVFIASFIN